MKGWYAIKHNDYRQNKLVFKEKMQWNIENIIMITIQRLQMKSNLGIE